jgi:hypothetical protein
MRGGFCGAGGRADFSLAGCGSAIHVGGQLGDPPFLSTPHLTAHNNVVLTFGLATFQVLGRRIATTTGGHPYCKLEDMPTGEPQARVSAAPCALHLLGCVQQYVHR